MDSFDCVRNHHSLPPFPTTPLFIHVNTSAPVSEGIWITRAWRSPVIIISCPQQRSLFLQPLLTATLRPWGKVLTMLRVTEQWAEDSGSTDSNNSEATHLRASCKVSFLFRAGSSLGFVPGSSQKHSILPTWCLLVLPCIKPLDLNAFKPCSPFSVSNVSCCVSPPGLSAHESLFGWLIATHPQALA